MGWEMGRRFKREGTCIYLWLIHVDAWQKPVKHHKAIILKLKINLKRNSFNKERTKRREENRQVDRYDMIFIMGIGSHDYWRLRSLPSAS